MGTKDFANPDIQYQSCTATIQNGKESYLVRIVNQNEARKDEQRLQPGSGDFLVIIKDEKMLGEDEFLDGFLESGSYETFPQALETILQIYER